MKDNFNRRKIVLQNKGQVTTEYLLLAVVLIAFFGLVTKVLRDGDYLRNFQERPKRLFKNIVENGNWRLDPQASQARHPNQYYMHYTPNADEM